MDHGCLRGQSRQSFGFCFPFVYNNPLKIFTIEKLIFSPVKNLLSALRQWSIYWLNCLFLVECTWHCYPGIDHKYIAVVGVLLRKKNTCNELNMLHKERSRSNVGLN